MQGGGGRHGPGEQPRWVACSGCKCGQGRHHLVRSLTTGRSVSSLYCGQGGAKRVTRQTFYCRRRRRRQPPPPAAATSATVRRQPRSRLHLAAHALTCRYHTSSAPAWRPLQLSPSAIRLGCTEPLADREITTSVVRRGRFKARWSVCQCRNAQMGGDDGGTACGIESSRRLAHATPCP